MNTKEIQKKIEDWTYIQNLGFDVLKSLSDNQLGLTVGKNMGTLGEQFRHMCKIRFQYAEAIENKVLGKTIEKIDLNVAKSKELLVDLWQRANGRLLKALGGVDSDDLEIDWQYWHVNTVNIHDHLNYLMDHETLHNGQIIVYLRTHELSFPESWADWGL
ncbi:MAG: DinB family protein [Patescibacteria group bacterium]